jgi:hypothetical protein
LSYYQKRAILPYVLFLVTVAMFAGRMEPNEEVYRGSYIDASCQVWLHLAKQFQRRRFFKHYPIRNKNCPWWPYLLAEWDEMKKIYRGPYIDAFCQVWFHLAQLFQRSRLKYEKVNGRTTDDGRRTPSDDNTLHDPLGKVS